MKSYVTVLLAVFCLQIALVLGGGLYPPNSNVVQLTKSNFAQEVFNSDHVWLVEFYAPWCGHCKNLVSAWEAAATNLKGIVKVGAVNCDDEKELAGMFQIKGFPTIKVFPSEKSENPHQKGLPWKNAEDYNGARTAAAIATFATNKLPNHVITGDKKVTDFLARESKLNKVLLFSEKSTVSNLYKALAIDYLNRLEFAQVSKDSSLVSKYGVSTFPTLIVLKGEEQTKFDGKLKHEELTSFLTPFAAAKPASGNSGKSSGSSKAAEPEPVEVIEVKHIKSQEDLENFCYKKSTTCAIAFLDTSIAQVDDAGAAEHEGYLQTLKELQEQHGKAFRFVWLDGPSFPNFGQALDVAQGYPQLAVVSPGKKAAGAMPSAFTKEKINEFLGRVKKGAKRTIYPVDSLPSLA